MSPDNENGNGGSIADRPASDGSAESTILAGAPDGAPYADDSSAGKDLGNAAAIAGYSDGGARAATPDVEGFTSGTPKASDFGGSSSGNGAGNASNAASGVDPGRTVDQSTPRNIGNPGGEVLPDDGDDVS